MAFHIQSRVNLVKTLQVPQTVNKRNSLDVLLQLIIICLMYRTYPLQGRIQDFKSWGGARKKNCAVWREARTILG
jgi:hypothetical protein